MNGKHAGSPTAEIAWRALLALTVAAACASMNFATGIVSLRRVSPALLVGLAAGGLAFLLELDRKRRLGGAREFARLVGTYFALGSCVGVWAALGSGWERGAAQSLVTLALIHALLPVAALGLAFAAPRAPDALWSASLYGLGLVIGFYAAIPAIHPRRIPVTTIVYLVDQAWSFGVVGLALHGARRAIRPVLAKEWPVWAAAGLSAAIMGAVAVAFA